MKMIRVLTVACCCFLSLPVIADNVTFSYQGSVKVGSVEFTGTGQFKFAVLNTSGTATLWSNDGTLTGEPAAFVSLPVTEGVFSVVIGDSALDMQPINSSIFSTRSPLRLRVWFNGGPGFEQLTPDQKLVDLTLNTVTTGDSDYTIYVNGTSGNDDNNGLTPATAKKTIQAGVNIVPAQLRCNVTIKIMPGDYKEKVSIYGISASGTAYQNAFDGNFLRILGDESWTSVTAGNPNVRIMASESTALPRERLYAVSAHHCSAVQFEGIHFDLASSIGAKVETGSYYFVNCKATNNLYAGFGCITGAFMNCIGCVSVDNGHGFYTAFASMYVTGCVAESNNYEGIFVQGPASANVYPGTTANSNTYNGISVRDNGVIGIFPGPPIVQSKLNSGYGLSAVTGGIINDWGVTDTVGNISGSQTTYGGHIY